MRVFLWPVCLNARCDVFCLFPHGPLCVSATDTQAAWQTTRSTDVTDTSPPCLHLPEKDNAVARVNALARLRATLVAQQLSRTPMWSGSRRPFSDPCENSLKRLRHGTPRNLLAKVHETNSQTYFTYSVQEAY